MGVFEVGLLFKSHLPHLFTQYFLPFYDYLHRELLKRQFLMADKARIQVLHEAERKAETDSFMWLFRSGEDRLPPIILYKYTETRAKFNALEFLNGFQRFLETDCYRHEKEMPVLDAFWQSISQQNPQKGTNYAYNT